MIEVCKDEQRIIEEKLNSLRNFHKPVEEELKHLLKTLLEEKERGVDSSPFVLLCIIGTGNAFSLTTTGTM